MHTDKFNSIVADRLQSIHETLNLKAKEYARIDRLHNFKVAGRKSGITPELALMGMKLKHDVSLDDIVADISLGLLPSIELLNEKIGDSVNYLILLEALIKERIDNERNKNESIQSSRFLEESK